MTVAHLEVVPRAINEDALQLAKELYADVAAGEVLAFAVVQLRAGGGVAFEISKGDHYHEINSGAARLAHYLAGLDQ